MDPQNTIKKDYAQYLPSNTTLDAHIKQRTNGVWRFADFELTDFTIKPQLIAQGGFSDIYLAQHANGKSFVLKLYNRNEQRAPGFIRSGEYQRSLNCILTGARNFAHMVKENAQVSPFVLPVLASENPECNWFLYPYIQGETVHKEIQNGIVVSDEGRILQKYVGAISFLHANDLLLGDHNWSNFIKSVAGTVSAIDIDAIYDLYNPLVMRPHTPQTASREHKTDAKLTKSSDIESCAKMLLQLLSGKKYPFLKRKSYYELNSQEHRQLEEKCLRLTDALVEPVRTLVYQATDTYRYDDLTIDSVATALEDLYQIPFARLAKQCVIRDLVAAKKSANSNIPPF